MTLQAREGEHYVRLAPGAAGEVAPYLGVPADTIDELALALDCWPDEIASPPRRARDGRLLEGEPTVIGACGGGLLFACSDRTGHAARGDGVLVGWDRVVSLRVVGRISPGRWSWRERV